jgi:Uma2 family endonuclease
MATETTSAFIPQQQPAAYVPRLENGDQLTRDEFERRYEAMPELKRAELIEGVVHMPSPVRASQHAYPHADLITWLGVYRSATPGVRVADNATIRLDLDNAPQPDGALLIEPAHGGQARIGEDDYVEGAPELVAEIAASSVSIALNTKFRVYRRNGVREYIVWRVDDQTLDWFVLRDSQFERLSPDEHGVLKSAVFPGLWLDGAAMVRSDLATVLLVLQQGIATPEHAAFIERLRQAAVSSSPPRPGARPG